SLWNGAPIKVDRKLRDPLYVEDPAVCVVGGIQPDLLRELADEAGRRDGFVERISWSNPHVPPAVWTEAEVSEGTEAALVDLFRNLRSIEDVTVGLSPEAKQTW